MAMPSLQTSHNLQALAAFGSVVRAKADVESDIDILVRFSGLPAGASSTSSVWKTVCPRSSDIQWTWLWSPPSITDCAIGFRPSGCGVTPARDSQVYLEGSRS